MKFKIMKKNKSLLKKTKIITLIQYLLQILRFYKIKIIIIKIKLYLQIFNHKIYFRKHNM